jgi:hypothetical protein
MSRIERSTWFERLLELRAGYGVWADDTEAVLSIADAMLYAEAVLAAGAEDEAWPPDPDDALTVDVEPAADVQFGAAADDAADGRPRFGRFFHLPGHPFGNDPA